MHLNVLCVLFGFACDNKTRPHIRTNCDSISVDKRNWSGYLVVSAPEQSISPNKQLDDDDCCCWLGPCVTMPPGSGSASTGAESVTTRTTRDSWSMQRTRRNNIWIFLFIHWHDIQHQRTTIGVQTTTTTTCHHHHSTTHKDPLLFLVLPGSIVMQGWQRRRIEV